MPYAKHNGIGQGETPLDGVEITDKQYQEAIQRMAGGELIAIVGGVHTFYRGPVYRVDVDGYYTVEADAHTPGEPLILEAPGKDLVKPHWTGTVWEEGATAAQVTDAEAERVANRRLAAKADIDRAAGKARSRFISPGALVDQEYLAAENAAQSFKDAGYPSTDVPPEVQAWADAAGMTATAAADDILATATAWRDALAQIRALRLQGKADVDAAADADIETVAQSYIDQLDAVQPA